MGDIIDLVVGFDQKEAVAYHTFVQSVIENASNSVRFMPLNIKSLKINAIDPKKTLAKKDLRMCHLKSSR